MELQTGVFDVEQQEAAKVTYANHVQFVVTATDIMLDFFLNSPSQHGGENQLKPIHLLRVALPLTLIKGFTTALANAISGWEAMAKTTLINTRQPSADDKINLWP